MKPIFVFSLVFSLVFASVFLIALIVFLKKDPRESFLITGQEAMKLVDCGKATLIDVREPYERAYGFIKNSLHVPLGSIAPDTIPKDILPIIFYCRSGKRSLAACAALKRFQPTRICYSMVDGMAAWPDKISGN